MKHVPTDFSAINPMTEFEYRPIETIGGNKLVIEVEQFLTEEVAPKPSKFRGYGMMIIGGLAKSGNTIGVLRPPKSS